MDDAGATTVQTTRPVSPRRWHVTRRVLLALAALIGVLLAASAFLLLTPAAAEGLTRLILARTLGLHGVTMERVEGSVLQGFTATHVRIPRLIKHRHPSGTLEIEAARMAPLLSWKARGPTFSGRGLHLGPNPLAEEITAASAEGSTLGGIVFHEVRFARVRHLPHHSTIDVQQLESGWPINFRHLREVRNGRLRLAQAADPLVFFGQRSGQSVDARLFAKVLSVQEVLTAARLHSTLLSRAQGTVTDVNLTARSTGTEWTVIGTFEIERLSRQDVALEHTAGTVRLQVQSPPWHLMGQVRGWGGTFTAKQVVIAVRPSTVSFTGEPAAPAFDLQGAATVGATTMQIALTGTKDAPTLTLTSEPPLPQEALLAMLVTGKSWRGAREAMAEGAISSELATDFIDYMFFGGFGNRIGRRFGITDFGITQDPEHSMVGAQTTFGNRMTLDIEVDPRKRSSDAQTVAPSAGREPLPYKVGAEYQVTDRTSVRVEGEHAPLEQKPAAQTQTPDAAPTGPAADDSILLKIKRRF